MILQKCLLGLALLTACAAYAQQGDTAAINKLLDKSKSFIGSDFRQSR